MKSTDSVQVDKTCRLSGYHLPKIGVSCQMRGYCLLLSRSPKVKISLPGSDSEKLCVTIKISIK